MMEVRIQFDAHEVEQLRARLERTGDALVRAMVQARLLVISRAMGRVPVRTGNLRRSLQEGGRVERTGPLSARAIVGSSAEYAAAVEFGTRPHIIEPVRAKVLRFMSGGRVVFARRVNHPGTKGKFYLTRSIEESVPDIRPLIVARLRESLLGGASA